MVGGSKPDKKIWSGVDLSSTEMHHAGDSKWRLLPSTLPVPVWGIRGATVDNTVYVTGQVIKLILLVTSRYK